MSCPAPRSTSTRRFCVWLATTYYGGKAFGGDDTSRDCRLIERRSSCSRPPCVVSRAWNERFEDCDSAGIGQGYTGADPVQPATRNASRDLREDPSSRQWSAAETHARSICRRDDVSRRPPCPKVMPNHAL